MCLSLSAILPRGGNPLEAWLHILYPLPTNGVTTDQGKTTPKIKGIPLEQAQMYAQYGIELLGLKKKTEKKAQKKAAA